MHLTASPGFVRRFPLLWGTLTATYAFAIAYRAVVLQLPPGLPTFAGFSAVAAVWLDYYAFVRSRILLRFGVILSLLTAAGFNAAILAQRAIAGQAFSFGRLLATLLFLFLFGDKMRAVIVRRDYH